MKKLSIFQKIWFSVGILVLGCFISLMLGFIFSMQMEKNMSRVSHFLYPATNHSQNAKIAFKEQIGLYMEIVKTGDQEKAKLAQEKADEVQEKLDTILLLKGFEVEFAEPVKKFMADHKAYTEEVQKISTAVSKGDQSIKDKAGVLTQKGESLTSDLDAVHLLFKNTLQTEQLSFITDSANQRTRSVVIFAVVIILSLILMYIIIRRSIALPLKRVTVAVNEGATNITEASQQVARSGQALSDGASNQASAIEETSASLTEMSAMIKQNALNAGETDKLMKKNTGEVLRQANEAMGRLVKSIEDISGASEATRRIIKTIDEIAFQTNLLALNAAVEAARAGEAGAGFAVVADEVRALAMRSAEAAKETTRLIDNTIQTVNQGKEYAAATQSAFGQNVELSNKATTLISEIASASNEQSSGIEQMNGAMSAIDQVVQEIAASAEETASASEELNAQSASMKGIVEELVAMLGMDNAQMTANAVAAREMETTEEQVHSKFPLLK